MSSLERTSSVVSTADSLLLEIDSNTMVKLVRSEPTIKAGIDKAAVVREIKTFLVPNVEDDVLADVVDSSTVFEFKPNEKLIEEDADDDVEDDPLLPVGVHDDARDPSDESADDEPDD